MAAKVSIEGGDGHYKRSVADLLVRRLLAEWVDFGKRIRMLGTREAPAQPTKYVQPTPEYIPALLPPHEITGKGWCKFLPPTPTA